MKQLRPALLFGLLWAVGGVGAFVTGRLETLIGERLAGTIDSSFLQSANIILWWAVSGSIRGALTLLALTFTLRPARLRWRWLLVTAFALIWLTMGALHLLFSGGQIEGASWLLLLPVLLIGLVVALALRASRPGLSTGRLILCFLGWAAGLGVLILALWSSQELVWRLDLPNAGVVARLADLAIPVVGWSLYGATGGLATGLAVCEAD